MDLNKLFARLAGGVAHATGTPGAFLLCVVVVLVWGVTGPVFQFSDTWQLVINTGTTIVTFLMVFLIQNTQNRDGAAIQIKLDELILTSRAENDFIGIEKLTDVELEALRARCAAQAAASHSLGEKAGQVLHARRSKHETVVAEVEKTPPAKGRAAKAAAKGSSTAKASAKPAARKPAAKKKPTS
jgi:low affinity Fe/Cu permease